MKFLLNRVHGCVCVSCRAAAFLGKKLSGKDFQALWNFAQNAERLTPPISLELSVDNMHGLSRRTVNYLKSNGICTVESLVKKTEAELLRFPNIGCRTMGEIKDAMTHGGRELAKGSVKMN